MVRPLSESFPKFTQLFRIEELSTAIRVLRLAGEQQCFVGLAVSLGLAAAIFEGAGLSFLIPLAEMAIGGDIDYSTPMIGPLLEGLGTYVALDSIHVVVVLIVSSLFLGILIGYLNLIVSNVLAMRFAHQLRLRVFDTALSRPLAAIESLPSGKFVNNLATETWRVCDALFVVISVTVQIISCMVFLAFLFLLSPLYTLVLMSLTAVMAVAVYSATRAVRGLGAAAVAANEAFMAYVWDALGGLRVIRGFGREAHERRRYAETSGRVSRVFTRLGIVSGLVSPITQMMTVAMVATILGIATARGDQIATLVGFLAIAYRMQPRVSAILGARTQLRSLEASVSEIETALAEDTSAPTVRRAFPGLRRGVMLENVSVRYPNAERPALHNIFCSFPYGQVAAVAGLSGAGKSTLVALLLRFIEPERGRIVIDGTPLAEIEPEHWHRRIAFVEQNAFLFNASVRENIGYGDLEADLAAIQDAARIAQATDFIEALPETYDTVIGDHGVRLSQGQCQRVALARSLLRKPDVLILDEATNALDRPTERALRAAIQDARSARAIIIIAHRRETIENADQVIVLDQGRVVQTGTPTELARANGLYAQLYLDQVPTEDR
jgi:subfamily B ATP-binding cassette protein MsbA